MVKASEKNSETTPLGVLVNWGSVWGGDKCGKLYGVKTTQAGGVSGFE